MTTQVTVIKPAALAHRVGCQPSTARRYGRERMRIDFKPPTAADTRPRCRCCGTLEAADEPLGRSGLCVGCWWTRARGWHYYAYRMGRASEAQREALREEFGRQQ